MKNLQNKVIAITGTASGIGKSLALQLAAEGAILAISDVNPTGLKQTYQEVAAIGGKASQYIVDVSQKEQVYDFAKAVIQDYGHVDIIINNAGVALGAMDMETVNYEELDWIFGINLWGVIYGTKAFLPAIKSRPEGAIINISSVFGLSGIPQQGPYCMTKFAVRGLTESLRGELKDTNVLVMQVHPGGIKTNIARSSRNRTATAAEREQFSKDFEQLAKTTPEEAARVIIKGLKKNKSRIRIGADARLMDRLVRFFPIKGVDRIAKYVLKN